MIKKTEVMILGSWHFTDYGNHKYNGPEFNACTEKKQKELEVVIQELKKFQPEKIAVEFPTEKQKFLKELYHQFKLSDFDDLDKMKNETLSVTSNEGDEIKFNYNNETVQIGFRLAKLLKHKKIYAIDHNQHSLPIDNLHKKIKEEKPELLKEFAEGEKYTKKENDMIVSKTVKEAFKYLNRSELIEKFHSIFYLNPNIIGAGKDYTGSNFLSIWYDRNIKIFANLQKISENCGRVFVLYGAGHLAILQELIKQNHKMKLVDIENYLK